MYRNGHNGPQKPLGCWNTEGNRGLDLFFWRQCLHLYPWTNSCFEHNVLFTPWIVKYFFVFPVLVWNQHEVIAWFQWQNRYRQCNGATFVLDISTNSQSGFLGRNYPIFLPCIVFCFIKNIYLAKLKSFYLF